MSRPTQDAAGAAGIARQQQQQARQEFRSAVRALLMTPLMGPEHPELPRVRRHAEALREWFAREAGWPLVVERDGARLFKRPADLADPTRGLPRYDRRRYALLCLACAVRERSDAQTTLRTLGERLLQQAADPALAARGLRFTLETAADRRDLVTVCQTLLGLGVLQRIAGDEEGFVAGGGTASDALYDVQRRALAGMLAAVRGPSTWPPDAAPVDFAERLASLVREYLPDTDEGRRTALRHQLARRLLDDPVVYLDELSEPLRDYFTNQRGAMAARLCEATELAAEQRAEGLALVDEAGELSDVPLPAEGTEAHATLLVAGFLAQAGQACTSSDVAAFLAGARERYGRYWRKSAREPGGEHELASLALGKLLQLALLRRDGERFLPLPALARYAVGEPLLAPAQRELLP